MNKPQQQTLSVRISDTLRQRLERAKYLRASTTGARVSLSDVAKQLLESAREDRLELVNLLARPTDTLLQIRRKAEAQQLLSRAEWSVLAHFVQRGLEACSAKTPNPVCRDSLVAVLDAFLAVYELRTERASSSDALYVGHLPVECRPATGKRASRSEHATPDVVRRTVTETRRRLSDSTHYPSMRAPLLAGRNLSVLLEDEPLAGPEALNRAFARTGRFSGGSPRAATTSSRASRSGTDPRARIPNHSRRFRPSPSDTIRSHLFVETATISRCS